jgi:hypothetical protein
MLQLGGFCVRLCWTSLAHESTFAQVPGDGLRLDPQG